MAQLTHRYQLNYTYIGICSDTNAAEISVEVNGSQYTIAGLEEGAIYFVLLTAVNDSSVVDFVTVNISTLPTGKHSH